MLELPPSVGLRAEGPKKRLLKAKDEERAFVLQYSQIAVDEAHFRPTCEANGYSRERQRWWTSPRWGEKACYYSGVFWRLGRWKPWKWKQQCRDLHRLFTAAKSKPSWTLKSVLLAGSAGYPSNAHFTIGFGSLVKMAGTNYCLDLSFPLLVASSPP